jgi:hypothetical protein
MAPPGDGQKVPEPTLGGVAAPKLRPPEPRRLSAGEFAVQSQVGVNPTSNRGKDRIRPVERSDSSPSPKASVGIDVR